MKIQYCISKYESYCDNDIFFYCTWVTKLIAGGETNFKTIIIKLARSNYLCLHFA